MLIKVNVELLNSAVVAWSKSKQAAREEVRPAIKRNIFDPDRTAVSDKLDAIIAEKVSKYKANFPGVDIISPKSATVRSRVLRFENDPVAHDLKVSNPGPTTLLEAPELVLVRLIEEMAEGGLYMNGEQLCARWRRSLLTLRSATLSLNLLLSPEERKMQRASLSSSPRTFFPAFGGKKTSSRGTPTAFPPRSPLPSTKRVSYGRLWITSLSGTSVSSVSLSSTALLP